MLVLSRKQKESIRIGDAITIHVTRIRGDRVQIGIDAPRDMKVTRTELDGPAASSDAAPVEPKPMPAA
jgi:carbon storage regulator